MANVLLTSLCNRSCPYCFAETEMAGAARDRYMSWENLIYIADFLKASGHRQISLLGGEPTIHPDFVDFVLYLVASDFDVAVFTNGILSSSRLAEFAKHLTGVPEDRLNFVCNLNDPVQTPCPERESRKVHEFLLLMGKWTTAGFNIYRADFELDFLFDAINRYGLKRHLRIGMTHPIPGQRNSSIKIEDMRGVVQRLYGYRAKFDQFRVKPGLDCGFPICQFSDEELGWLHRFSGPTHFGCGPAFDIAPDMSVYYCFPLSSYQRRSLFEFDSARGLDEHFRQLNDAIKSEIPGIFPGCDGCKYREDGVCTGGGLCQAVNRFVEEAPIRLVEIENEFAKASLPQ